MDRRLAERVRMLDDSFERASARSYRRTATPSSVKRVVQCDDKCARDAYSRRSTACRQVDSGGLPIPNDRADGSVDDRNSPGM